MLNALYPKPQNRKNFVFLQNIILLIMKKIKYVIYKEGKYYVSQCLNVDISSFGTTIDEASANLKEALQLYFEGDKSHWDYLSISEALIGETQLNLK
jgi:predicted RNase H-like HicB family nuclease